MNSSFYFLFWFLFRGTYIYIVTFLITDFKRKIGFNVYEWIKFYQDFFFFAPDYFEIE